MRFVTIDQEDRLYEVTRLYDRDANATSDPWRASTCVIRIDDDNWVSEDADFVPIYTVH